MYRTFNMGMGYAYVVPKGSVDCVLKMVKGAQVVGRVVKESGRGSGRWRLRKSCISCTFYNTQLILAYVCQGYEPV